MKLPFSWLPQYMRSRRRDEVTGIRNFGTVDEGAIYRGAKPEEWFNLYQLFRHHKVKTWIDLRLLNNQESIEAHQLAKDQGIVRLPCPIPDNVPIGSRPFDIVLAWLADTSLFAEYISCEGGRHRASVMIAAYRIILQDWPWKRAWDEAKQFGWYDERGHEHLKKSLIEYIQIHSPETLSEKVDLERW